MVCRMHMVLVFSCLHLICLPSQQVSGFCFNGFAKADLDTDGNARILPNGILQLTSTSPFQMGHAFFKVPFDFGPSKSSFYTHFVFALVPPKLGNDGGDGIAFVVSRSKNLSHALTADYLGLFGNRVDGNSSHMLAIELDTVETLDFDELKEPHVGIDVKSPRSVESARPMYFSTAVGKNESINLLSGKPIQVWVDYDGLILNVSLAPTNIQKPDRPLMSRAINLSETFKENMFVGFSGATGKLTSNQYILAWRFSKRKEFTPTIDLSELPKVPLPRHKRLNPSTQVVIIITCAIVVAMILGAIICGAVYLHRRNKDAQVREMNRSNRYAEVREPWEEEDGPPRFSYDVLYNATNGFDGRNKVGKGGYGEVFKGILASDQVIAVKRLFIKGEKGKKQLKAEVVSMGNLKHHNLVLFMGYCITNGEFLLVYDFMPYGSLDQYLFYGREPSLSWSERMSILEDIASAVSYMHTESKKVVLHRDIKAANVMLDSERKGKLGDFGMAKLHDHGANASSTAAVGTFGYMAPELFNTRPSTETDVYAFGIFILEVTCGRRPLVGELPEEMICLNEWVLQCWKEDRLIETIDPKLGGDFLTEQVKMVLTVGLMCTKSDPKSRPTMLEVVKYLKQELRLPYFSPSTPGTGTGLPVLMEASSSAVIGDGNPRSSSLYISHSIVSGNGR